MVRVMESEGIEMGSESEDRKYGVMEGQGEGKAIDPRDNKHPHWLFPLHSQIPPPRTPFKCWFMGAIYCHWEDYPSKQGWAHCHTGVLCPSVPTSLRPPALSV